MAQPYATWKCLRTAVVGLKEPLLRDLTDAPLHLAKGMMFGTLILM